MAGTAAPYTGANVPQGPAMVWFDIALPGAAATPTLHTDGTPDASANPSARFLGKLKAGVKFSYKPKQTEFLSDESTAPFRVAIESDDVMLSGEWMELQNTQILLRMMPGASRTTGSGYERLTVGGLVTLPTYVIMLVWQKPEDPTKYVSLTLYKAINMDGLDFAVTRKEPSSSSFNLKGLSIDTRAVGDQVFQINVQV